MSGNHTAENRIQNVDQGRGMEQSVGFNIRFYEKQTREIAQRMIKIHQQPLTLPSRS